MVVAAFFAVPYLVTMLLIFAAMHRALQPDSRFANSRLLRWSVICAQLFLGMIIFTGGMSKLMPFWGVMGPVWLEDQLSPHGLGFFARFVAWSETVIGLLLLTRRFSVLGAIMLVPLLVNMLMVTISLQWQGTPTVLGFFLLLNVLLLAYRFDDWKSVLTPNARPQPPSVPQGNSATATMSRLVTTCCGAALVLCAPLTGGVSNLLAYFLVFIGFGVIAWAEFRAE